MLRTPDDHSKIELTQFHTPAAVGPRPQELPVNALGYRRIVRGPEGIIIGLADQEEMNMIEAIVESGGASFLELLEGHEAGNLRSMSLKTWLLVERGFHAGRPKRIAAPYEEAWQPVLDSVRLAAGESAVDDDPSQQEHE